MFRYTYSDPVFRHFRGIEKVPEASVGGITREARQMAQYAIETMRRGNLGQYHVSSYLKEYDAWLAVRVLGNLSPPIVLAQVVLDRKIEENPPIPRPGYLFLLFDTYAIEANPDYTAGNLASSGTWSAGEKPGVIPDGAHFSSVCGLNRNDETQFPEEMVASLVRTTEERVLFCGLGGYPIWDVTLLLGAGTGYDKARDQYCAALYIQGYACVAIGFEIYNIGAFIPSTEYPAQPIVVESTLADGTLIDEIDADHQYYQSGKYGDLQLYTWGYTEDTSYIRQFVVRQLTADENSVDGTLFNDLGLSDIPSNSDLYLTNWSGQKSPSCVAPTWSESLSAGQDTVYILCGAAGPEARTNQYHFERARVAPTPYTRTPYEGFVEKNSAEPSILYYLKQHEGQQVLTFHADADSGYFLDAAWQTLNNVTGRREVRATYHVDSVPVWESHKCTFTQFVGREYQGEVIETNGTDGEFIGEYKLAATLPASSTTLLVAAPLQSDPVSYNFQVASSLTRVGTMAWTKTATGRTRYMDRTLYNPDSMLRRNLEYWYPGNGRLNTKTFSNYVGTMTTVTTNNYLNDFSWRNTNDPRNIISNNLQIAGIEVPTELEIRLDTYYGPNWDQPGEDDYLEAIVITPVTVDRACIFVVRVITEIDTNPITHRYSDWEMWGLYEGAVTNISNFIDELPNFRTYLDEAIESLSSDGWYDYPAARPYQRRPGIALRALATY